MSTFVLVHGAWQSSGTWDLVVPLLKEHDHDVITPTLSGLGSDQNHLSRDITLQQHISDVSAVISNLREQVVLVGHSYAGMIISGVAETNRDQIQRLIFMDAFIPDDGQSVLDLLPAATVAYFRDVARNQGEDWRLPGGEGHLDLWGLKPGKARDFVRSKLCDFSLRCFEGPLSLPVNHSMPATFIEAAAEDYPARPLFKPFAGKALELGWDVTEINAGHDCHVEHPAEIARILLSCTASQGIVEESVG
jgi:pimeloyl-ACP methyl ester carboxylesterase